MNGAYRAAILIAALCLAGPGREAQLLAQEGAAGPNTVIEVRVEGNRVLSESAVLANVKTRPGRPYSQQVVQADVKRLAETGRFEEVLATESRTDKGVIVTFQVKERPLVAAVVFRGNKALKDKDLQKILTFGEADPIAPYQIARGTEALESKYRSAGYNFVKVELDPAALRDRQEVVYTIEEGPRVTLRAIRFEGNQTIPPRRLKRQITSRARLWPFRPGVLDTEALERDVVALRNFYHAEGYLEARVGRELKFSPDKRRAELSFLIHEGARYRIRKTVFEGNSVFADEEIRRYLKLTRGEFAQALALVRDLEKIRSLYGEIGYIDAEVASKEVYPAPDEPVPAWLEVRPGESPALVDLVYSISEAQQFRVGRIDIRGNRTTRMNVIRRHFQIRPEQYFNTVAVAETQRRLFETGLFGKVTITPFGEEPGVRHALVEVEEGQTRQFLVGGAVSTNVGLYGNFAFRERNFDILAWPRSWDDLASGRAFKGGGQTFSVTAQPGTDFMRFHIDWQEPYLFDRPYLLGTRAFAFSSRREAYDEMRYGGLLSLGHRFQNRWYGEVAGHIESIRADNLDPDAPRDVRDIAGTTLLTGVKGTLVRDNTDSRWLPSKGDRISVSYEQVLGDFEFGRAVADYRIYHTVYVDPLDRKHILAARATAGAIFGDAPVFERFYGGGLGSIRGFEYRGISPRQGPGEDPVGGDFMTFLGAEYTFPLAGRQLRGVIFLDSGTVERDIEIQQYRVSAGFGVRIHVPFMAWIPMSLDFGFPIRKGPDDDTLVFSFSIGWVF